MDDAGSEVIPLRLCTECGFFALRRLRTQQLAEAPMPYRAEGNRPLRDDLSEREDTERLPVCSEQRRSFSGEYRLKFPDAARFPEHSATSDEFLPILNEPIHCAVFTEWQQGFSPKEHREMLDRQWKIKQEILVREAMWKREDDRDTAMTKREDDRDKELRRLQERLHGRELWIMGGLVTGALVVGQVIAAVIEGAISNGWGPPTWPW